MNKINNHLKRIIGFELKESKEKIFEQMLQMITDFTIPLSTCQLFYQDKNGLVLTKQYQRYEGNTYYLNGDVLK